MDNDKNPVMPESGDDVRLEGQPLARNTPLGGGFTAEPTRLDIAPADIEAPTMASNIGETHLDGFEQAPSVQEAGPVPAPAQGDFSRGSGVNPAESTQPASLAGEQPSSDMFTPTLSKPPKKPLKKGLLAVILASSLVLFGGGGALAYNVWYQNPDKVVTDSIINVIRAKSVTAGGTFTAVSEDFDLSVAMHAKGSDVSSAGSADVKLSFKADMYEGLELAAKGSYVMAPEGDVYIRIEKLAALADAYVDAMLDMQKEMYSSFGLTMSENDIAEMRKEAMASVTPAIKKIDGQWIKISAEDIKEQTKDSTETVCYQNVAKKLQDEKSMSKEVYVKYTENRFITVKEELGSKDGSLGYVLGLDKDAAKSFGEAMKGTEVYKELEKCGDEKKTKDIVDSVEELDDEVNKGDMRVELWIDRFSHDITSLVVTGNDGKEGDSKTTFDLNLATDFNSKVTIDIPENSKTFKEIEKDVKGLTGATEI